jgi:hypothetical protein
LIVSAHQPSYFPWLGWLHKVDVSDVFILMDEVQLSDSGYQHRNIFLTKEGGIKYLTIPFEKKNYQQKCIFELKINKNINWQEQHLNFIVENYKKHPFYNEIIFEIKPFYLKEYDFLIDFLLDNIKLILQLFNIKTEVVLQSNLDYNRASKKNELILELVKSVKSDHYFSGQGAKSYLKEDDFKTQNIQISYQNFEHPIYEQKNSKEFCFGMNCSDILFNLGIEKSQSILKNLLK